MADVITERQEDPKKGAKNVELPASQEGDDTKNKPDDFNITKLTFTQPPRPGVSKRIEMFQKYA